MYLPEDAAIPAPEVPAPASFEREFVSDKSILQREAKESSAWLTVPAHLLLALIMFGELAALAWGIRRLRLRRPLDDERDPRTTRDAAPEAEAERPLVTA